jgi:DNA (cytosine-5)-methyltransferase 1
MGNKEKKISNSNQLTVLDLFAGAGGMSTGFEKAGYKILAAVEYDPRIKETYEYNHPETKLIVGDIREISVNQDIKNGKYDLEHAIGNVKCDIIVGGPPCQGFSMAGNRIRKEKNFFQDERNLLFLEYFRMVKILKPKVFVIENVPGILNYNNGKTREEIIEKFNSIGYDIHTKVLTASDFGVPQIRKRAFIIGNNVGIEPETLFPTKSDCLIASSTVEDAIGDLPDLKPGESIEPFEKNAYKDKITEYQKLMRVENGKVFNHASSKPSDKTIEILKQIKQGQGIKDLPEQYHTKSVHSGAYGRMVSNKASYTLTTRLNTPSVGRITHPKENRTISPREAARIQSFDDSYRFFGNITSLGILVENNHFYPSEMIHATIFQDCHSWPTLNIPTFRDCRFLESCTFHTNNSLKSARISIVYPCISDNTLNLEMVFLIQQLHRLVQLFQRMR